MPNPHVRLVRRYPCKTGYTFSISWSPDGKSLAATARDETVRIFDAASGSETRRVRAATLVPDLPDSELCSVDWSPNGKHIAVGIHTVCYHTEPAFNYTTAEVHLIVSLLTVPSGPIHNAIFVTGTNDCDSNSLVRVAWTPDSQFLALIPTESCRTRPGISVHDANAILTSPSLTWDLCKCWEFSPRHYDAYHYKDYLDKTLAVAWSPEGKRLAIICRFKRSQSTEDINVLHILDAVTGKEIVRNDHCLMGDHFPGDNRLAWSPDGRYLAAGYEIIRSATGLKEREIQTADHSTPNYLAWSPDGRYLATGSEFGSFQIVDPTTGTPVFSQRVGKSCRPTTVAWSPGGNLLAVATDSLEDIQLYQVD